MIASALETSGAFGTRNASSLAKSAKLAAAAAAEM
jgi:hypothetical protein